MKAHGVVCFIKLGWFWFVTMTTHLFTLKCLFFSFLLSLFHLLPFHCRQNKMRGVSISSAKLGDKTHIKLDVLWMFHHFIPVCETTTSLNLIFPPMVQRLCSPWSKSSYWAPREWADQHPNTNRLFLLFVSYFCQVWQLIKLK